MEFKLSKSNLNFRVRTAETMPSVPGAENEIVIITKTPMRNWIMSPDMPTNAPRTDGDVWIQYSVNGDVFNAVKVGGLMISTMTALQYIGGAWVGVPAMVFPDGKKIVFLYNAGNECNELTGGWQAKAWSHSSNYTSIADPTVTKTATGVTIKQSSGSTSSGAFEVLTDVDVTNVKSITFDFSSLVVTDATSTYTARLVCAVLPRTATRYYTNATKCTEVIYATPTKETDKAVTVDVSALSGSYDIAIGLAVKNATITVDLRSVKMEVA